MWENKDFNIFSKHKCTAWITTLTIWADWNIRPCNHADKTYWNIFDENMSDIWLRMKEWRTWELLPEKCKSCEFVFKCTWWCRMEANSAWDIKWMDPFSKTDNIWKISEMLKNLDVEKKDLKQKKIKIQPRIVFREDKNCFIIDIWDWWMTITKDSWILLKKLLDRNYFTINELSEEFDVDIEILNNFFNYLLNKGFIKIL